MCVRNSRDGSHTDVFIDEVLSSEVKIYESVVRLNCAVSSLILPQLFQLGHSDVLHCLEYLDHVVRHFLENWVIG